MQREPTETLKGIAAQQTVHISLPTENIQHSVLSSVLAESCTSQENKITPIGRCDKSWPGLKAYRK